MRQSIAILSVLAGTALAQDVVSFFFPGGYDGAEPVATIESVNPSTTQFLIACPTGTDASECGWGPGLHYTIISGTQYQASMSYDTVAMSLGCDYNTKAVEMTCTASLSGGNDDTETPQTAVLSGSEVSFIPATVVEGASLLSGGASASASASATPASQSTSLRTTVTPSASGTAAAGSQASGSGATPTASGSSPAASTGAAARFGIEGSALLALAGAAALHAW